MLEELAWGVYWRGANLEARNAHGGRRYQHSGQSPVERVAGLGVKLRGPGVGLAEGPRERGFWVEGLVSGLPSVGEEGIWGRPAWAVLSVRES